MCVCVFVCFSYEDDLSGQHFKVRTAFQVIIEPSIRHSIVLK